MQGHLKLKSNTFKPVVKSAGQHARERRRRSSTRQEHGRKRVTAIADSQACNADTSLVQSYPDIVERDSKILEEEDVDL